MTLDAPRSQPRHAAGVLSVALLSAGTIFAILATPAVRLSGAYDAATTSAAVRAAIDRGQYPEAVAMARSSYAEAIRSDGESSPRARDALRMLVEALWRNRDVMTSDAAALAKRSVAADEREEGPDSPAVAGSLLNLGRVLTERGEIERAEAALRRSLAIREATGGDRSAEVALTLSELAWAMYGKGDENTTRALLERAKNLAEAVQGPDSLLLGDVLARYGSIERYFGHFYMAKEMGERGLAIRERVLGPFHPLVAESLRNVGTAHHALVEYDDAIKAFERALSILDTRLPDHALTAMTHMNTANLLMTEMGDYVGARAHYERCIAIITKVPITDTWMGAAYQNYATLLERTGDYDAARPLYERAIVLRAGGKPPDPTSVAFCEGVVGDFYMKAGNWPRAEELLDRSLATLVKYLGPNHAGVIQTKGALSKLFLSTGRPREAARLAQEAVDSCDKTMGPRYPLLVEPLDVLGNAEIEGREYLRARPVLERELAIQLETRGEQHPLTCGSLVSLARLEWLTHDDERAFERALRAEDGARSHLRRTARVLSEREALRYEAIRGSGLDLAATVVEAGRLEDGASRKLWDEIVRSRALVLDEMAERHRSALHEQNAGTAPLLEALTKARNQLAHLAVGGPDPNHPDVYRKRLDAAGALVDRCERDLGAKSETFRREQEQADVGLEQVLGALPADGALVSYVQFNRLGAAPGTAPEPSYLALIARHGSATPAAVPLGSARAIDALVHRWKSEASAIPTGPDALARYLEAGAELRRAIWDPVSRQLGDARSVLIVPDGELNLVAFHTLPVDGSDRYLVETGPSIQYLSAERDLVGTTASGVSASGLLAFGGPDFDSDPDTGRRLGVGPRLGPRVATTSCAEFQSLAFPALASSEDEVEEVKSLWLSSGRGDVLERHGDRALEGEFKRNAPGRSVIHLATHSFSLESLCSSPSENPFLLSGLAFAGANRRNELGVRADGEDGILTAEEVASLDLRGVSWVVLSACDSGVGPVQTGEGILGLRRAFEVAGARTLISSLWPVTDHDAREWIRRLYEGRLSGMSTTEAARGSTLRMIQARRQTGATTHPFFWGAFVAAGDPS